MFKKWLMSLKANNLRAIRNKFRITTFNKSRTTLHGITTFKIRIDSIFMKFDAIFKYNIALKFMYYL